MQSPDSLFYAARIQVSLDDRIAVVERFLKIVDERKEQIAKDITGQMGRPFKHSLNEVAGVAERTRAMINCAPEALATQVNPGGEPADSGFYKVVCFMDCCCIAVLCLHSMFPLYN